MEDGMHRVKVYIIHNRKLNSQFQQYHKRNEWATTGISSTEVDLNTR
jgi:hypothetical protein